MSSLTQNEHKFFAHIEITPECGPVKYEYDPEYGLVVDRFMRMPMHYPLPYGYIPKTLCDDGDALDVLVRVPFPILPTSWVQVRPIGVLLMEDEKGADEKILAVPVHADCYASCRDIHDVDAELLDRIHDFFTLYKQRDQGKWSRVEAWMDAAAAREYIARAFARYASALV